ncbi:hypothetical protein HYU07_07560 [Candidatus Woesearchaeota archaeon]|nr:hypothetical protein [Candidatus Woesearchaeota archaeon]
MKKQLEILVVEDQPECIEAAKKALSTKKGVNAQYASDYFEAIQRSRDKRYHGALIDLYFPEKANSSTKILVRSSLPEWEKACEEWGGIIPTAYSYLMKEITSNDESEQPLGFLLGKELKANGIPLVIVSTAEYGHGSDDNPFYALRVGALKIFDLKEEFEGNGIMQAITEDVYEKVVREQGKKIENLKRELYNAVICKQPYTEWIDDLDDVRIVECAIKYGVLKPIKGIKTYKRAFEALKEKLK